MSEDDEMSFISFREWSQERIRDYYSKCVAFYRFMGESGVSLNTDLMIELRYEIEDSFDAVWAKDIHFHTDEESKTENWARGDSIQDKWLDLKESWLDEHPEWYATDVLTGSIQ
jgi:hypothetical protein